MNEIIVTIVNWALGIITAVFAVLLAAKINIMLKYSRDKAEADMKLANIIVHAIMFVGLPLCVLAFFMVYYSSPDITKQMVLRMTVTSIQFILLIIGYVAWVVVYAMLKATRSIKNALTN